MSSFALMFLMVFFGGLAFAIFKEGAAAFIVYELVYFANPEHRWWYDSVPALRYSLMTVLFMAIVYVIRQKHYNNISPWGEQKCFKWMIVLVVIYFISGIVALDPTGHQNATIEFTKMVIIMHIAYKVVDTPRFFDFALWAYIAGACYVGYMAYFTGRDPFGRVEGIGMIDAPDANDTAAALVPAIVLLLYFAWQGGKYSKLLALVMGGVIANGLVLINSRGSFLGVIASVGTFLLFMIASKYQREGQRKMAILVIVMGLSGGLYLADETFWARMETLKSNDSAESGSQRMDLWWSTFDMMQDHPFGMGVNGYNILAPFYTSLEAQQGISHKSVHSSWFQAISEVGYHGLFVFVVMLVALLRQSFKAVDYLIANKSISDYFKLRAVQCALLGYLVPATFINRFRAEILYWMILFLALAIKFYYLNPKKEGETVMKESKSHGKTKF